MVSVLSLQMCLAPSLSRRAIPRVLGCSNVAQPPGLRLFLAANAFCCAYLLPDSDDGGNHVGCIFGLGKDSSELIASLAGGATAATIGATASGGSTAGAVTAIPSPIPSQAARMSALIPSLVHVPSVNSPCWQVGRGTGRGFVLPVSLRVVNGPWPFDSTDDGIATDEVPFPGAFPRKAGSA